MARLEYYIMERTLRGTIGAKQVHFFALSGGGGGRSSNPFPTDLVNNPYFESREYIKEKHQEGGPILPGWYWILHSNPVDFPKHGKCVRLLPMKDRPRPTTPRYPGDFMVRSRGPFFIHGRGSIGSEGCIVPMITRPELEKLIEALDKDGGGTLYVDESFEGYRFA
jgi:hypothetical protein